ncbi:hypothetical protein ACFW1A_29625 [Kitasatospora sp. NPDC058965]|uniref:hypothetical protein n=1 Tax=Kitasatospora sp. NPDC058965 TaxID=3346682 RepID=UPI0036C8FA77
MSTENVAAVRSTAMYLRCYPYDPSGQLDLQLDLTAYAARLGLAEPTVYRDNGARSTGPLPALAGLLAAVRAGAYQVVLVPGPFVFSLDDRLARATVRRLAAAGCEVVERSRTDRPEDARCALVG